MTMKRVVVLLSAEEYEAVKREAGEVPLSRWIRNAVVPKQKDAEGQQERESTRKRIAAAKPQESELNGMLEKAEQRRGPTENLERSADELPAGGTLKGTIGRLVDEFKGKASAGRCPHGKTAGMVCQKCDPKMGFPEIR